MRSIQKLAEQYYLATFAQDINQNLFNFIEQRFNDMEEEDFLSTIEDYKKYPSGIRAAILEQYFEYSQSPEIEKLGKEVKNLYENEFGTFINYLEGKEQPPANLISLFTATRTVSDKLQQKYDQLSAQKNDVGEQDYQQYLKDQQSQQERSKNARPAPINYLQDTLSRNFITSYQEEIRRIISSKGGKGLFTINVIVDINFNPVYKISGSATLEILNQIQNDLKSLNTTIISILKDRLQKDNMYLTTNLSAMIFNGNV